MAVFQADELEIVYEGEERMEGEKGEEAEDCFQSASGLVLLQAPSRASSPARRAGGRGTGQPSISGGFSFVDKASKADARGVAAAAAYQGMTQSKTRRRGRKKDARWPQAEQANDVIGGEEGQEEQDCGREGNWEKKLVTSPGISGDTWAVGKQDFGSASQPVRICGPVLGCGDRSTNVSAARLIAGADSRCCRYLYLW